MIEKMKMTVMLFVLVFIVACQSKPTVIEASSKGGSERAKNILQNTHSEAHTVTVNEVLQTSKYTYLNVKENGEDYWIAVPGREVDEKATYEYVGGLKKNNFKSEEFDRVFPTIYLVSGITEVRPSDDAITRAFAGIESDKPVSKIAPSEGSIALSDLFSDPSKYAGKKIKVKGQCVKVNNQIMGRNWIHIQDGTEMDGENYDLTATTQDNVAIGSTITVEGVITLDKDFGAGYRYDVIMEEATVSQ